MDNPGVSLFQGESLNLNNSQNLEEVEDIEEQRRRRQELENLIINELDDFKYDDSTINSSTNISVASADGYVQNYKNAVEPVDQLKVLCDVRTSELCALKDELDTYKAKSFKEIQELNRKLTLAEAEKHKTEISHKNAQSLLVEKADIIKNLNSNVRNKDEEISSLRKIVEELQMDVYAYNTTVDQLKVQLQMDTGGYNVASRVLNSEELQQTHRNQIIKLETLLDEHKRKAEHLEKENYRLQEELKRFVETASENESLSKNALTCLTKNIESAQQQCKDLLNLVEVISNENEHYKERIQKFESAEPILLSKSFKTNSLDYDTLCSHNERLKKMLLDKNVEVCTLKSKSKFYEKDVKELLEYRAIKNKGYLIEDCGVSEHRNRLSIMQNLLENGKQTLLEKETQIVNLNMLNKELQEKIEEMIVQTRSDLENLSSKYKVPELKTMSGELEKAQDKIDDLEQQLAKAKNDVSSHDKLIYDLKVNLKESAAKITNLEDVKDNETYRKLEESKLKLEEQLEVTKQKLTDIESAKNAKIEELKKQISLLYAELTKIKNFESSEFVNEDLGLLCKDIENFWHIYKHKQIEKDLLEVKIASWVNQINVVSKNFKQKLQSERDLQIELKRVRSDVHVTKMETGQLKEEISEITNANILLEGERCKLEDKLAENQEVIQNFQKEVSDLKSKLIDSGQTTNTIETLCEASDKLGSAQSEIMKYQEELIKKNEIIQLNERNLNELQAEHQKLQLKLKDSQNEMIQLQEKVKIVDKENVERHYDELEEVDGLNNGGPSKDCGDSVQNVEKLKTDLLTAEVMIRDQLRHEYHKKVEKIEEVYKNIFEQNKKKLDEYKGQEKVYRKNLDQMLDKYTKIITPIRNENEVLREQLLKIDKSYTAMKMGLVTCQKEYEQIIEKTQSEAKKSIEAWKLWAKTFVKGCVKVEQISSQARDTLLNSLNDMDTQITTVEKYFDGKIKQYKRKNSLSKT